MVDIVEEAINANKRVESLVTEAFKKFGENAEWRDGFLSAKFSIRGTPVYFDRTWTPLELAEKSEDGLRMALDSLNSMPANEEELAKKEARRKAVDKLMFGG